MREGILNQTSMTQHQRRPLSHPPNGRDISRTQMMRMMKCLLKAWMIQVLNQFRMARPLCPQEGLYGEIARCHFLRLSRTHPRILLQLDLTTRQKAVMSDLNCLIHPPLGTELLLLRSRCRNGSTTPNLILYIARASW